MGCSPAGLERDGQSGATLSKLFRHGRDAGQLSHLIEPIIESWWAVELPCGW